jgi:hypothetical protein
MTRRADTDPEWPATRIDLMPRSIVLQRERAALTRRRVVLAAGALAVAALAIVMAWVLLVLGPAMVDASAVTASAMTAHHEDESRLTENPWRVHFPRL